MKKYISKNIELMKEWDWEKNKGLDPNKLTEGSNKKVNWICSKGHKYQKSIYHRAIGSGCSYCSGRHVLTGFNDLQTLHSELVKEWDYDKNKNIQPTDFVIGSNKKVWWKCLICGTSWQTKIIARTKKNAGCPKCNAKKRVENHRLTFLKKNGSITDPLLLQEWNYARNLLLTPKDFTPASNKYVWWKCSKCGYEWRAKISNRSVLKRGCPACKNLAVIKGKNDLATTHPLLAKEWHPTKNLPLTPYNVPYGTRKKVWWICPKGHEYQASILHRSHGTNCPICNNGRQTSFHEQAIFHYVKQIFPDAINRYKDIFKNGMELDIYIPSIKTAVEYDGIFYHKQNKLKREMLKYEICQQHNIKLIRIKEADITKNKDSGSTADLVYHIPGLGNTKEALNKAISVLLFKLISTFSSKYHIPININTERDKYKIREYMTDLKKNSLADLRHDLAKEWHPTKNGHITPNMVSLGASRKVWWLCSVCRHEWEATISHRANGTGCPKCSIKKVSKAKQKPIQMLDPKTNSVIREFESISDAGREMKINHSNIAMVCKGIRPKAGGYKWRYKK